ncbi:Por secretion system C-terminal sorting domain-containing protein [Lishizhenia tianjinensis]|uniref:Por secretion system C-terminal sorting domain-containing protein n=1 Tax=Lishizhenia tianjinensis TaxID=477690 RepID=A0A1I7BM47_9FLAO|nr:T9SS type A sorting domain-containing protein [Lishizhenia tianjinensis]SFT88242.1 Por secretion system C-terminal sorting domain-containing protein [Lishizhenia tianjinensis]
MRRIAFAISILLSGITAYAQESVAPLIGNPSLQKEHAVAYQKSLENSFDSTFVYQSDSLELPFFDDFSRNNFQVYPTDFTGAGVTEELYYSMLMEASTTPMPAGSKFTTSKTFKVNVNVDNNTSDTVYYDSTVFEYNALDIYPVNYIQNYGYPNYFVFDTLENGNLTSDTVFVLDPEFEQYEARIFFTQLNDSTKLWLDTYAYHNYRMAKNPITLGVATFDGLNEFGYPYNFGSITNALCDYLTSKPINMGGYQASDSVYFSFLYQTEGLGDPTESDDSLYVEFYSPVDQVWERVWSTQGGQGTNFNAGHIRISDAKYFADGFQFRFVNYGLPSGALDQFHVDYVMLREMSAYDDTLFEDFAFAYPLYTLLKDYTQVPWDHYRNNPNGKMTDALQIALRNNQSVAANNSAGGSLNVYYNDVFEGSFNFVGADLSNPDLDYAPRTHYFSEIDLSGGYSFDANLANDTMAEFDWIAEASVPFNDFSYNDSTFGTQTFKAVYAYDDGTAELAYGPNGTQVRLAYKFEAYEADSLVAIQIHFVPAANDVSNKLFLLTVWGDDNGEPGAVLYQDDFISVRQPQYTYGNNGFYTYYFKDTAKVPVDEVFYIGWRQLDADRLNVGLDMNIANNDKIFFSLDGENSWENTGFEGSVMMRPMFSTKLDYQLSTEEIEEEKAVDFTLYPNPSSGWVNLKTDYEKDYTVAVYDLGGRELFRKSNALSLDLANFDAGIYLVSIYDEQHQILKTAKIVKR